MRPWSILAKASLAITVSVAAALAVGISSIRTSDDDAMTTGSLHPTPKDMRPTVPLSEEQRGRIHAVIIRQNVPIADLPHADDATTVPGSIAMHDLPKTLVDAMPLVKGYKFVKLDDRILLVNPADRAVAAQIPRYRLVP
jgi:hypothetical protein